MLNPVSNIRLDQRMQYLAGVKMTSNSDCRCFFLNQDGTKIIDQATGQAVPTYTNDDIMNFSRGWTNFEIREESRDNIEAEWSQVRNCIRY